MSFVSRQISVSFTLGSGNFQGGGNNAKLDGLRISARIDGAGGLYNGLMLSMAIYGMSLSDMNQLTTVGRKINYIGKNEVSVTAGGVLAFKGILTYAWVDAQAQPNVCFRVQAAPGAFADVTAIAPTSVQGQADVATLMQTLAGQAGFQFENNNVTVKIANPYLPGSVGTQIKTLAHMAGIEHIVERGKLAIWMPGTARSGGGVTLSPKDGTLVSYPAFNSATVMAKSPFNANIANGTKLTISGSALTPANGDWSVFHVTHEVEANLPRGKWFTLAQAASLNPPDTP